MMDLRSNPAHKSVHIPGLYRIAAVYRQLPLLVLFWSSWIIAAKDATADFQFYRNSWPKMGTVTTQTFQCGFQPKAVIFYWVNSDASLGDDLNAGFGFTDGTDQRVVAFGSQDGKGGAQVKRMAPQSRDYLIFMTDTGTETITARAELVGFLFNGVSVNWTQNDSNNQPIHYACLGGSDITQVKVADFGMNNMAVNPQDVTSVGFQPDFLMFATVGHSMFVTTALENIFTTYATPSIGFASASDAEGGIGVSFADTNLVTKVRQRTDNAFVSLNADGTERTLADIDSFLSNGFRINKTASTLMYTVSYLAVKGGTYKVGSFNKKTDGVGTQSVDTVGFEPAGLFLASSNQNSSPNIQDEGRLSFSTSSSLTEGSIWFHDVNGGSGGGGPKSVTGYEYRTTRACFHATMAGDAPFIDAQAVVDSMDPDGFTLDWLSNFGADPHEILYVAFEGVPSVYRSVGTSTADLNTSARTVEISGSTATFSGPMPDNVGVGDVLQYGSTYLAFIHGRTSDTVYTVRSATGEVPQAAVAGTAVSVYRAYTSLFNWEAQDENTSIDISVRDFDTSTDLVTDNVVMKVACYGDGVDTTMVIIDGWTTGESNYIKIYTPFYTDEVGTSQRHDGKWNAGGYIIQTGVAPIRIGAATAGTGYVWIDGLQVYLDSVTGSGNSGILVNQTAQANHRISNNIVRGVTDNTFWHFGIYAYAAAAGSVVRIWNNVVYDFDGANRGNGIGFEDTDITSYVYSNTVHNCFYGYRVSAGTVVAKNNIAYSSIVGGDNYAGTFDASSTNNLSGPTQSDAPPTNARQAVTVNFVNEAGDDFHLDSSDSGAQNFGTDLSSDTGLEVTLDIDSGRRSTPWDIGADDYFATTAVELIVLEATGYDGDVHLEWETGSEIENLGFHLYRSSSAEGPYARITSSLVPGLGSSPAGARYSYRDTGLTNGVTYYYKLEDVETTGNTEMHGPVSATPQAGAGSGLESSRITVGKPEGTRFHVVSERPGELVLELRTEGFYAEPLEDGTVRLEVPGFSSTEEEGFPTLPVKLSWVPILAGRNVKVLSVETFEEEVFDHLRPENAGAPVVEASERTVRLGRHRRVRRTGAEAGTYPPLLAQVLETAFQGEVKKARVEMAPLRWDGRRLVLAHRMVVRLSLAGRDKADRPRGKGLRGRRYGRRPSHEVRRVVARLVTREAGLYGVSFEELTSGCTRTGALRLSRQGETVPFYVPGGVCGPGATLYFLSEGSVANPYGDEAVYELETGVEGESMATRSAVPSGESTPYYWERVEKEKERLYQATLVEVPDRWLWSVLYAPARESFSFQVSELAATPESSRLTLWLQGGSDFPADPDHHVRLTVNGVFVGERRWNGKEPLRIETETGPGILREGENRLEIESVNDTEAAYSMVMVDRYEVSYPRRLKAREGRLEGSWSRSGTAEIAGVTEGIVVEKAGEDLTWLEGVETTPEGVRFRAEAGGHYTVVSPEAVFQVAEVRRPMKSHLKDRSNRADYLMIGPRAFVSSAGALLELRKRQRLRAKAVAVEDVFSEFGFGEENPKAIQDFLSYAYHQWAVGPRYVVLLGDGTYDFKDHLGTGAVNRVPPLMVMTRYLETASDPSYAAVNGDDLLPDIAIGRLPAATVEELETMVAKIVAFEDSESSLQGRVVMVTDNPDRAGDFVANAEALASTVLRAEDLTKVYLSELGKTATKDRIRQSFDEGASLMSYIGHGGIHLWADENIFNIWDVPSLSPQPVQPILLTMNCLNGYFHFPYFNALAEEVIKAEGKGAIAAFSPSGLSLNDAAHVFHRALLEELVHEGHDRLGDAVLAAQGAYAEAGATPEMLAIYHLFGDPALQLRP